MIQLMQLTQKRNLVKCIKQYEIIVERLPAIQ